MMRHTPPHPLQVVVEKTPGVLVPTASLIARPAVVSGVTPSSEYSVPETLMVGATGAAV